MTHPRGRQPIGFNQPPNGGMNYPVVDPSDDIKQLFADFFISFENTGVTPFKYPLKLAWLYGFGTNPVTPPPGRPTPTHVYDLIVEDAEGNTVFDSTLAGNYSEVNWDGRLKVIEWNNEEVVCRCVIHTAWTQEDVSDGLAVTYDDYIEPQSGELYAECCYELPKRVRSITVGNETVTQKSIVLQNGYNCDLVLQEHLPTVEPVAGLVTTSQVIPGVRKYNRIEVSAEPGSGLGVFPGCVDTANVLRTVNKISSNTHNNLTLDSEGCIRNQRPVGLVTSAPRSFNYSTGSLSPSQSASAVRLSNDCKNCCDCEYYARTYQGLKRQWLLYRDIARQAELARDLYRSNRERWLIERANRARNFINVRIMTDADCKVRWGVSLCNVSNCCLVGIKIQLFFMPYTPERTLLYPSQDPASYCPDTYYEGSPNCFGASKILPAVLDTKNLVNLYEIDYADPQTMTVLYGKHCIPLCYSYLNPGMRVRLGVIAYWDNKAPIDGQCEPSPNIALNIPQDIISFCGLANVTLPEIIYGDGLSPEMTTVGADAGCVSCDCKPEEDE